MSDSKSSAVIATSYEDEKSPDHIIDHKSTSSFDNEIDNYDYDDPTNYSTFYVDEFNPKGLRKPTVQEEQTLRRVLGRASYAVYLICLVELAERASYYSVQGLLANFVQRDLPPGSTTGAPTGPGLSNASAGALGMGSSTASALTLLLQFLAYVIPLYGGFVADAQIGKVKAIWIGVAAGFVSHVLFIIAGIPSVISGGHGVVPTVLAIITLAFGTGFIKPNLLPLLMDQYPYSCDMVRVLPTGEHVIVDRQKSFERMTLVFYWAINIGAFFQLATSYCAKRVGFWLAFFIPMIMYLFLPVVLFLLTPHLVKQKPEGSVLSNTWRIFRVTFRGGWIKRYSNNQLWEYAKPSNMLARGENYYKNSSKSIFGKVSQFKEISWNDQWVLDIKQTVNSCKIFIYYPIFNLCDGGIGVIETSQAGAMTTKGVPNDLFNNFNPLTIIILIPILDYLIYPTLRKYKIDFKPVYRITFGFVLAAFSQVAGAIIQYKIYTSHPCGYHATDCSNEGTGQVSPMSAWQDVSLYILSAAGECFAMTTGYELAYTRSPPHMKGLVMALFLFTTAISAAISEAVTPAIKDPYLIWPFAAVGIAGVLAGFGFLIHFWNLDKEMEKERLIREELDRQTGKELAEKDGDEFTGPTGLADDRNLAPVTSIKSAVGK